MESIHQSAVCFQDAAALQHSWTESERSLMSCCVSVKRGWIHWFSNLVKPVCETIFSFIPQNWLFMISGSLTSLVFSITRWIKGSNSLQTCRPADPPDNKHKSAAQSAPGRCCSIRGSLSTPEGPYQLDKHVEPVCYQSGCFWWGQEDGRGVMKVGIRSGSVPHLLNQQVHHLASGVNTSPDEIRTQYTELLWGFYWETEDQKYNLKQENQSGALTSLI